MDSWTDKQLALMKNGGNQKCNDYLKAKGIDPRTPIKEKYESDVAQLYKEILKAKVEGRPEPTSLPKKTAPAPYSGPSSGMNRNGMGGGVAAGGSNDPNGMERLSGETDQQYIARQTRLKEEARARMQAKFGNSGGRMGGVGSGGSMQGIGSNPNYNPNSGGYGGGLDLDGAVSSVTSVFSSGLSMVSSVVNDEQTRATVSSSVSNLGTTVNSYGGSFWNSLKATVNDVAVNMAQPDEDDGLVALQRQFESQKPAQSKYGGFGSDSMRMAGSSSGSNNNNFGSGMGGGMMTSQQQSPSNSSGGFGLQEAPGLPGEDRNGMERLTGETDEQYVLRQTRLRDEAKARMAAKFGGGGLSSASSSSSAPVQSSGNNGGFSSAAPAAPTSFPSGMALGSSAKKTANPSSGFSTAPSSKTPARKLSSDDFFADFGS